METFLAAYSMLGLAVVIYVARLGIHQHRLQRQLDAMEERSCHNVREPESRPHAA